MSTIDKYQELRKLYKLSRYLAMKNASQAAKLRRIQFWLVLYAAVCGSLNVEYDWINGEYWLAVIWAVMFTALGCQPTVFMWALRRGKRAHAQIAREIEQYFKAHYVPLEIDEENK